jgi:hypothetical protein
MLKDEIKKKTQGYLISQQGHALSCVLFFRIYFLFNQTINYANKR